MIPKLNIKIRIDSTMNNNIDYSRKYNWTQFRWIKEDEYDDEILITGLENNVDEELINEFLKNYRKEKCQIKILKYKKLLNHALELAEHDGGIEI